MHLEREVQNDVIKRVFSLPYIYHFPNKPEQRKNNTPKQRKSKNFKHQKIKYFKFELFKKLTRKRGFQNKKRSLEMLKIKVVVEHNPCRLLTYQITLSTKLKGVRHGVSFIDNSRDSVIHTLDRYLTKRGYKRQNWFIEDVLVM